MVTSIIDDIKSTFRYGDMVSKLIIINVAVFVIINLIRVFTHHSGGDDSLYSMLINYLAIPAEFSELMWKPWTLFTHMFLHEGFWHIVWNMLLLFWFGRIVGDFLNDNRVLPLYIMGGLFGGLAYMLTIHGGFALGASAAVMAFVVAAAVISPDYIFHLILIGPVRIKYIAMAIVFMDIVGTAGNVNTGGHFAHLGGAVFGGLFVYMLRNGFDLSNVVTFTNDSGKTKAKAKRTSKKKSPLTVFHKAEKFSGDATPDHRQDNEYSFQDKLDKILEKIKKEGYENLSPEEKEFLYQASKKE